MFQSLMCADSMALFIIFALLLTSRLVCGVTETVVTRADRVVELTINLKGKEMSCTLETNRNEVLEYKPGVGKIREDIETPFWEYRQCTVKILRVNSTHAGMWKIKAQGMDDMSEDPIKEKKRTEEKEFSLHIQEEADIPVRHIEVYDGYYVNVKHLNHYETLESCSLTGPTGISTNLLTDKSDDLHIFGQCGVRMKVNVNFTGEWKLVAATDSDFVEYIASFDVNVHQLQEENPDPNELPELRWIRGATEKISLSIRPKICQILDPSGAIVATTRDQCFYEVKVANIRHEGIWRVRYNVQGMLEPIEERFRIKTDDPRIFNTSVNRTADGATRLLCRLDLKSADSLKSCSFVRPDNETLYMTPAVGDERYSSYVNPRYGTLSKALECGITIRELGNVDYGTWRCNLGVGHISELYGSVLHIDYADPRERENTDAKGGAVETRVDDVHVKRGDPFTVKCTADSVLKYCWLRSPNGTAYSVKVGKDWDVRSPFVLPYIGNGLSYGECGAKISTAADSDDGQWSCSMGVVNSGKEEVVTVSVTVSETYLVAEQTEIAVSRQDDPVLSCRILPRMLDRTVHYCRWIRPDGYGIYNDISHRYTAGGSYSQCRLVILNYNSEEDEGRWTCVAGLAGKSGQLEEAWAYVEVSRTGQSTVVLTGIIIGVLAMISLFAIGYIIIRRHRVPLNNPPPYFPEYSTPKSVQPTFDTKDKLKYDCS